ncbi:MULTISPECIES: IS1634 family transposase [Bacteria]|uniref:Transposase n=2 Tax=Candidatus Methylacidithermus pantelleriae TaxID=2744239 RepID=A0A8J2FRI3_9BACT|nr:transposase [Candidatus Methylacidithermus pantelleriae]
MYVREIRTHRNGKVYRQVVVRESYRVGKKVKTRNLANLSRLPVETQEVVRASLKGQKLVPLEGLQVEEVLDYGGLVVLEEAWRRWGLEEVLAGVRSERKRRLIKAMIFGRILFPSSKCALRNIPRGTVLPELCGVEEKDLEEEELYGAMDGLNGVWSQVEKKLYRENSLRGTSLVLYDLPRGYLEGTNPQGLARYGHSRDHRGDPCPVLLAIATNAQGVPIHVEVLRANRADSKTLVGLLVTLQRRFGIREATFVFDGGMQNRRNLAALKERGLPYVTRTDQEKLQELVRDLPKDRQLCLTDRSQVREVESNGVRYVIAGGEWQAFRDRAQRESRLARAKEVLAQITKGIGQGADPAKLGRRVGWVLSRLEAHKYFQYGVDPEGRFWWKLNRERIQEDEAIDGWYLLETNLSPPEASPAEIVTHYKRLAEVESAFSQLKSSLELRPVYHWGPATQVRNPIRIFFLAYWLTARLRAEWVSKGFHEEVSPTLRRLQAIRVTRLLSEGKCQRRMLCELPRELSELVQKLGLLPLFSHGPKWIT